MKSVARLSLVLVPALASGCVVVTQGGAPVTPQRPTFSSDTNTTAAGTLEVEAGLAVDPGDALNSPTTVKLGVDERTEVYVGFSPYVVIDLPGDDANGFGDTVLGTRHRFWEGPLGTTTAVQLAFKLPTGDEDEGLGSGELDGFLAAIATQEVDEHTAVTLYYELGVLGDPDDDGVDVQHAFALAASRALIDDVSLFGEVVEIFDPYDLDPVILTLGVAHAPLPSLVVDAGVAVGLDSEAPDLQLLVGLTSNLGRVLHGRPPRVPH